MNYEIIKDEKALRDFIDWLPELKENETYYCSLFCRKKYCPEMVQSNDKTQLKRFTSNKERLFDKIKQLELPFGRWKIKGQVAPQEGLVLYINPNPRCQVKAAKLMAKKCLDLIFDSAIGYNIQAEALSCIQRAKSRSVFVDFDIDEKEINLSELDRIFPVDGLYELLETRGGYHVLVKPAKVKAHNKTGKDLIPHNWYKVIQEHFPVDVSGDNMIPVAGCTQGGFMPKFLK